MTMLVKDLTENDIKMLTADEKIKQLYKTGLYSKGTLEGIHPDFIDDLYLKYQIENGAIDRERTSRPYVIRFPYQPQKFLDRRNNIYDLILESLRNNPDVISNIEYSLSSNEEDAKEVINNFPKLSNRELEELMQYFANGLLYKFGINYDKRVGIMSNGAYEEVPSIFALSALGTSIKPFDFFSPPDVIKDVLENNYNILIIDEKFVEAGLLDKAINVNRLPIIVLNATHSYDEPYYTFRDIVELGKQHSFDEFNKVRDYIKAHEIYKQPKWELNTSGTTGPKKVLYLSDEQIINACQRLFFTSIDYGKGNSMLKIIPNQLALGLVLTLIASTLSDTTLINVRSNLGDPRGPEESGKDLIIGTIRDYLMIRDSLKLKRDSKYTLSIAPMFLNRSMPARINEIPNVSDFLRMVITGGNMTRSQLDAFNAKTLMLYGQNENAGLAAIGIPFDDRVIDDIIVKKLKYDEETIAKLYEHPAYYPAIGVAYSPIKIFDGKTIINKTVAPGEEIILGQHSPSTMMCKYSDEQATINAFVSGTNVFNTNDKAININNQGDFIISGRLGRSIDFQNFKIDLDDVEKKAKRTGVFENVSVVQFCTKKDEKKGKKEYRPFLFGIVKEGLDPNIEIPGIMQDKLNIFGTYSYPIGFVTVDKLPSTPSGKRNVKELEKLAELATQAMCFEESTDSYGNTLYVGINWKYDCLKTMASYPETDVQRPKSQTLTIGKYSNSSTDGKK